VRTTLTLDDDVAAKLRSQARRSGRPFREVVNEALRRGLVASSPRLDRSPYVVKARDLGALRPGLTLDNVGELLEQVEGPGHR
jgi:Ribbon-helix-helix protein, copG family